MNATGATETINEMLAVLSFLLSPIGRVVGVAALALSLVGGIYAAGAYNDHRAYTAKLEKEAANAVDKANAARLAADKKFNSHPILVGPKPHAWSLRHDPDRFSRD
jgi:hypothetical protein